MTLSADFVSGQPTTFRQLRRMMQDAGAQEGVVGTGSFAVTQRGAGANMSVDIAPGTAWVQIDTGTNMGLAHILSDAVANQAVTASHATLPRVDIATLRYNDAAIPAGSGNVPTLQVIAGTPTAGAQIATPGGANYRAGAPALPNDSLWCADILVPATSTSVVNANIGDQRPFALESDYNTVLQAGGETSSVGIAANSILVVPVFGASAVQAVGSTSWLYRYAAHLDPADYALTGRSAKYRLRVRIDVNAVAPGSNLTFSVNAVTLGQGASGSPSFVQSLGAQLGAVTFTAPAIGFGGALVGAEFAAPAAGLYAIGFTNPSSIAVNNVIAVSALLQRRTT